MAKKQTKKSKSVESTVVIEVEKTNGVRTVTHSAGLVPFGKTVKDVE